MNKLLYYLFLILIYLFFLIKSQTTNFYYFTFKNIDANHCSDIQDDYTFVINFRPHNLTSIPTDCVNKTDGLITFSEVNGTDPKNIKAYCKLTYSNKENHIRCSNFEFNESYKGLYKLNDLKENINFVCNSTNSSTKYNITFYNFSYEFYFSDNYEYKDPNIPTFENSGYVYYMFDNILTVKYEDELGKDKIPKFFVGNEEIPCEIADDINMYTLYCYIDEEKFPVKENENETTYLITYLDVCDVYETDKNYSFTVSNKGNSKSKYVNLKIFYLFFILSFLF
jgi:hypothetical protein